MIGGVLKSQENKDVEVSFGKQKFYISDEIVTLLANHPSIASPIHRFVCY